VGSAVVSAVGSATAPTPQPWFFGAKPDETFMSVESLKELDDFFRSMRQAFNSRDLKTFRSHFWTDKRFQNLDASGRRDRGWGEFEEVLDQEFRYLDSVRLELKDLDFQVFEDQFATVIGGWRMTQVDPEGRNHEQNGRCTFSLCRLSDDWKIVAQHYSPLSAEEAAAE
jgi:ketosteroid isomerase-like protein